MSSIPSNFSHQPQPTVRNGQRAAWILGLTSLTLLAALAAYLSPLQPDILALQFTFDQASFQAILEAWKPEGVLRYRSHLPIDYGLLLCYGAFGYVLASKTAIFTKFSPATERWLPWVMPLAALCDAVENSLHWRFTSGLQQAESSLYLVAGISATLKCALLGVFLVSVLIALAKPATVRS